jgi:hypothetical protein
LATKKRIPIREFAFLLQINLIIYHIPPSTCITSPEI